MANKKPVDPKKATFKKATEPKPQPLSDYVNSDEYIQFMILTQDTIRNNLDLVLRARVDGNSDTELLTEMETRMWADLAKIESEMMAWHERAKTFED